MTPIPVEEWNEERTKSRILNAKQSAIKQFEALNSSALSGTSKPGFTDRLVVKIVDNLEISLKSIYIRYEDSLTDADFAIGVAIKEALAFTCNSNW